MENLILSIKIHPIRLVIKLRSKSTICLVVTRVRPHMLISSPFNLLLSSFPFIYQCSLWTSFGWWRSFIWKSIWNFEYRWNIACCLYAGWVLLHGLSSVIVLWCSGWRSGWGKAKSCQWWRRRAAWIRKQSNRLWRWRATVSSLGRKERGFWLGLGRGHFSGCSRLGLVCGYFSKYSWLRSVCRYFSGCSWLGLVWGYFSKCSWLRSVCGYFSGCSWWKWNSLRWKTVCWIITPWRTSKCHWSPTSTSKLIKLRNTFSTITIIISKLLRLSWVTLVNTICTVTNTSVLTKTIDTVTSYWHAFLIKLNIPHLILV